MTFFTIASIAAAEKRPFELSNCNRVGEAVK